ncbi:NADH-quinone oxidoreductase subunit J [Mumia sp. zg.B53]|uniref:NADH-quinone oxidoreductase subunit J family protein n=1 Tax=unclassified Mumia TaxID=2621872 RepID=UPI001C6E33BB|nr:MULTISPECIES: NADH-quinone oxidoreductase subunit J [unclassified Mumia]MBW9204626.1 NADH-quinone oxidoreductase subunit J [Mumia sp. zg.B17]MBW9213978.1 NADH-quinone oxidoreductase subunit J [Mumia sp. zg.B53]
MTAVTVVFAALGVVTLVSAFLVVTSDQIVHAALWLVVTLGAIAGLYILLAAELVAWVQVLIYIGSVVVLLLFALMLTRAPSGPGSATATRNQPLAAVVAGAVTVGLGAVVWAGFGGEVIDEDEIRIGTAERLGDALFRTWVLPFEVLSVVLLAALVGAIVLTRKGAR